MLTASMDRLTDFGGQAYAPRKSKEFCAANGVSCSRKHTLLCSGEHINPLRERMGLRGLPACTIILRQATQFPMSEQTSEP